MQWLNLFIALLLPALLGAALLALLVPAGAQARRLQIWGNGLLLGLLLLPLLMRILDALSLPISFGVVTAFSCALLGCAGLAYYFRRNALPTGPSPGPGSGTLAKSQAVLFAFFLALITFRLASLGLELWYRPLFPWDATMHWATKSRVWFEYGRIVPFVENSQWLESGGKGVFTDHHPAYPKTVPLLQVWVNSALGRWDESLMNLPWLLCLLALGAAFYGQARAAGSTAITAIIFTYMLLSMPLLNVHVALAGYADLFLGACYCAALMAFHNWSVSRQYWQGALAVIFACFCPLLKNEGFYWLLTFLPALAVVLLPARKAVLLLAGLLLLAAAVLVLLPTDLSIAGHSLDELRPKYRPRALWPVAKSVWIQDNWHLLGYLLAGLIPLALLLPARGASSCRGIATAMVSAVCLFLFLFLFTKYAGGAVRFTAVGRVSLQLVPALMFMSVLLYNRAAGSYILNEAAQLSARPSMDTARPSST